MYNPQVTHSRIKEMSKVRKITIGEINKSAGLGENAISQLAKSQDGMITRNLYEIAQCLDCSVDYLLGRSENPQSHKCPVTLGEISNNSGVIGGIANSAPVTINNGKNEIQNNQEAALLEAFRQLDEMTKAKALIFVDELNGEK